MNSSVALVCRTPFSMALRKSLSRLRPVRSSFLLRNLKKSARIRSVPDRRSRNIPEVVLVRRWAVRVLGIWKGEGLGEGWDKGGQFTSNLRPRWTIPVTARRVLSK